MSINETCKLIAETRKIIEGGHDGPANITDLLNLILQVVTNIDTSVNRMEKKTSTVALTNSTNLCCQYLQEYDH